MNDLTRTCAAIAVAGVLVALAALSRPAQISDARFSDQGEFFFPGFVDPTSARSLEVVAFDSATASFRPFKVEFEKGRWVIPSHHGYPADASENMGKAASAFIGLRKEQVVSDRAADHEALGVLAPDDPAAPLTGRGTRVTLKDDKGEILASIIVGGSAPDPAGAGSAPEDRPARRYVRLADKARVYATTFPTTFSTRFADWVETDLLMLGSRRIDRLLVDRYEVDETQGEKRTIERLSLVRITPAPVGTDEPRWTIDCQPGGPPGAGEAMDANNIEETMRALGELRIVGVRPKPKALAAALSGQGADVKQTDLLDLQSRGFFVTRDGKFVANDGEITATAEDGVVYNIAFGEVLFGEGAEVSAGADDPLGKDEKQTQPTPGVKESRYAIVRVSFDPTLFPEPPSPQPSPPSPPTSESAGAPEAPKESDAAQAEDPARVEYERLRGERDAKIAAGKARAEQLGRRFGDWYYVLDAEAFASLRPTRARVIVPATPEPGQAEPAPAPAPGG